MAITELNHKIKDSRTMAITSGLNQRNTYATATGRAIPVFPGYENKKTSDKAAFKPSDSPRQAIREALHSEENLLAILEGKPLLPPQKLIAVELAKDPLSLEDFMADPVLERVFNKVIVTKIEQQRRQLLAKPGLTHEERELAKCYRIMASGFEKASQARPLSQSSLNSLNLIAMQNAFSINPSLSFQGSYKRSFDDRFE